MSCAPASTSTGKARRQDLKSGWRCRVEGRTEPFPRVRPASGEREVPPPESGPEITHEDVDRARDRLAVEHARQPGARRSLLRRLTPLWLLIGPGILVFL